MVTYEEYVIQKLYSDGMGGSDTEIIKDLINSDLGSEERQTKLDGIVYYRSKNDKIMDRKMEYTNEHNQKVEELNRSNNKVPSGFLKILVDQKVDYLVGKKPTITGDIDQFTEIVPDYHEMLQELSRESSKKTVEALYVYVDEKGQFKYTDFAGEDLIFIYDTSHEKTLLGCIRYYSIQVIVGTDKVYRNKVEWYDTEKVTFYMEQDDETYILDTDVLINPQYHWTTINTLEPDKERAVSFGMVPIIPLWNNSSRMSDLEPIKAQIDTYDVVVSDFANNIEDIQDALVVISGYEGTDADHVLSNLKDRKLVLVGENGGLDYKKIDIPTEAREKILDRLHTDIFTFGQGFDPNQVGGGSITNVVIKSRYTLLDLKSNRLETQLTMVFNKLMEFVNIYLVEIAKKKEIECGIEFNRSMVMNESEKVEQASKSVGVISNETIWENHPFVTDVEQEKERMKSQDNFGDGE